MTTRRRLDTYPGAKQITESYTIILNKYLIIYIPRETSRRTYVARTLLLERMLRRRRFLYMLSDQVSLPARVLSL